MSRGTITSMLMLTFLLSIGCQANQKSRSAQYRSPGNYTAKNYSQGNTSSRMATKKSAPRRMSEIASQDASEIKPKPPAVIASRKVDDEKPVKRSEAHVIQRHSEIFLPPSPDTHSHSKPIMEKKASEDYVPPAAPGIRSPVIRKQ